MSVFSTAQNKLNNLNMKKIIYLYIFLAIFLLSNVCQAQFYNGHQMTFGKNRVQYRNYNWLFYRYDAYDVYFYENGKKLAQFTAEYTQKIIPEMENFFGYKLQNRIIFLVYNTQTDFRQSNIGLVTGNVEFNVGGQTQIKDNKVFLFFNGEHKEYKKQIRKVISKIIINEMLYGKGFKNKFANSTLINLPEWYEKGLISYAANQWDFEIENTIRDGILSGKYDNFNHITGKDAEYVGHSFWYYIAETYGHDVVSNIIYFTRINKNASSGFMYVTGSSIKQLKPEWKYFYLDMFEKQIENKNLPKSKLIKKRPKRNTVYQRIVLGPKGNKIAYITNKLGKYKIFVYDFETEKTKKIYKEGNRIEQIQDYTYPLIAWHPSGKVLSFITEEKGDIFLTQYLPEENEYRKRKLLYISKVIDFSYSQDGRSLVFSAIKDGYTDIFVFNIGSGTTKRITNDLADDIYPKFIDNSSKIIFSSNRISDTLINERHFEDHAETNENYDLFIYDFKKKNKVLTRLTNSKYINETQAVEVKTNSYMYLSDENGIVNRKIATFDSTISYIDTAVHYKYFTINFPLTNYPRNILYYDLNYKKNKIAEIIYNKKRFYMYFDDFKMLKNEEIINSYKPTEFRESLSEKLFEKDSLEKMKKQKAIAKQRKLDSMNIVLPEKYKIPDKQEIDINNYVFEIEKDTIYKLYYLNNQKKELINKDSSAFPQVWVYHPTFYMSDVVTQIDFGMLSESYQLFSGGPYYFSPGINMFMKFGIDELFEDYKITGGFRMGANLGSYEYLFSVENLKKRLDKQIIYHRQSYKNEYPSNQIAYFPVAKVISNELMYILRYPFNQVSSVKGTISARFDKGMFLSTEYNTLVLEPEYQVFGSLKTEYIFDNTRSLGLNLYDGLRFKIFAEVHQQAHDDYDIMSVLGADFRYYKKIHRSLIFASRFATSTSFGTGKLIYYLGGVDNWYSFSLDGTNDKIFNPTVNIDQDENYIYQAVATNMRGFRQNIRNGNSFALINTEIRFPFIRYFANRPINSDFFNNFQVVGFFDIGSAWSGLSPFDENNAYNEVIVNNNPITVIIQVDRPPFVAGYGFGVRSKFFGYFFRLDWAWGVEGNHIHPRRFYFSLNLDF